jgi:hypothetical protein
VQRWQPGPVSLRFPDHAPSGLIIGARPPLRHHGKPKDRACCASRSRSDAHLRNLPGPDPGSIQRACWFRSSSAATILDMRRRSDRP